MDCTRGRTDPLGSGYNDDDDEGDGKDEGGDVITPDDDPGGNDGEGEGNDDDDDPDDDGEEDCFLRQNDSMASPCLTILNEYGDGIPDPKDTPPDCDPLADNDP